MALVRLHAAYAGGGMGPGHLPFAGGAAAQPACVMRSLDVIAAAHALLEPKRKEDR